jgi:hypothetical protein
VRQLRATRRGAATVCGLIRAASLFQPHVQYQIRPHATLRGNEPDMCDFPMSSDLSTAITVIATASLRLL